MVVDEGDAMSAPVSVAERIAALQKGQDSRTACKSSTANKLSTAARPPKISKECDALADRIALFQSTADSGSHINSISVRTKPSFSIQTSTDFDRNDDDGMTTETDNTTTISSTLTKTNQPSSDQPPAKPNAVSIASRISALQKTIGQDRGSKSVHPSRNVTTSIQLAIGPTATQPLRPPVSQNTKEAQSTTEDHLSPMQEPTIACKTAADVVTSSCSSINQKILNDSEVQVKPILKDISNRMRNKIDAKKTANLHSQRNNKLNQESHHVQKIEHVVRKENEHTQVETQAESQVEGDLKSSSGVSDVDSDMITLPASNKNALNGFSFGTASSWDHEKTINGWQGFYANFDLPPPGMMLESQISTPVTKNTRRMSRNNNNNIDDDLVASRKYKRKGSRSKTFNSINPPHLDRYRIIIGNTDESQNDSDIDGRNNDSDDLKGCLLMDEIWDIFTSLSSAV